MNPQAQSPLLRRPDTPAAASIARVSNDVPFVIRPLLWEQISNFINPSEMAEVKLILGRKLIDDNEALQQEINSLLDIWLQFRQRNEQDIRAATPARTKRGLFEPPGRELLESKITMLLKDLQKKSMEQVQAMVIQTPREKEIFDYFSKDDMPSRPKSASAVDLTLNISSPRPVDTRLAASARSVLITVPLERIKNYLNIYEIQTVAEQLRRSLEEEHNLLLEDVDFLQKCMDEEWIFKSKSIKQVKSTPTNAPSLQDLKEFGSKLERVYLSKESDTEWLKTNSEFLKSPNTRPNTAQTKLPKVPKLRMSGNENTNTPL